MIDVGIDEDTIKLYETKNEDKPYVALSHCWGESQHILTKNDSIERWKQSIPWQYLPATFRDSVLITRRLGFQYLWIDSLCIVQDSVADWEEESANMGSIYQDADLVVSAARSSGSDQGCFSLRNQTLSFSGISSSGSPFRVFARQSVTHASFGWGLSSPHSNGEVSSYPVNHSYPNHPLFSRAWCFQERLLGRRIVHYTKSEIVWECLTCLECECNSLDGFTRNPLLMIRRLAAETTRRQGRSSEDSLLLWRDLVAQYSQRQLTFRKDTLPALSGLARNWASNGLGRYLAGLWESDLQRGLLWKSARWDFSEQSNEREGAVSVSTAPSWSWAKLQRPVDWINEHQNATSHTQYRVQILFVSCAAKGKNPFGEVDDGILIVAGRAVMATLSLVEVQQTRPPFGFARRGEHSTSVHLDWGVDSICLDNTEVVVMWWCKDFFNAQTDTGQERAMVLLKADEGGDGKDRYKRIGVMGNCPDEWDSDATDMEITIV